jgi:hypothetical protein
VADDLHQKLLAELDGYESMPQPGGLIDALRAVVELHAPASFTHGKDRVAICRACADTNPPCSTIQAIARELGVADA